MAHAAVRTVDNEKYEKMGWYKLNVWLLLFLQAGLDAFSGFEVLHGHEYTIVGSTMQLAHAQHGEWMHGMDYFVGGVLLLMAVFSIVTRFRLAGMHKDGIECLHILHYIDFGAGFLYHLILSIVLGAFCWSWLAICEQAATLLMIFINKSYFEHREHLFH